MRIILTKNGKLEISSLENKNTYLNLSNEFKPTSRNSEKFKRVKSEKKFVNKFKIGNVIKERSSVSRINSLYSTNYNNFNKNKEFTAENSGENFTDKKFSKTGYPRLMKKSSSSEIYFRNSNNIINIRQTKIVPNLKFKLFSQYHKQMNENLSAFLLPHHKEQINIDDSKNNSLNKFFSNNNGNKLSKKNSNEDFNSSMNISINDNSYIQKLKNEPKEIPIINLINRKNYTKVLKDYIESDKVKDNNQNSNCFRFRFQQREKQIDKFKRLLNNTISSDKFFIVNYIKSSNEINVPFLEKVSNSDDDKLFELNKIAEKFFQKKQLEKYQNKKKNEFEDSAREQIILKKIYTREFSEAKSQLDRTKNILIQRGIINLP